MGNDDQNVITFDFWSVESLEWALDFILIYFVLIFGKKFSCSKGKWGLFDSDLMPVSAVCVTEILTAFRGFTLALHLES